MITKVLLAFFGLSGLWVCVEISQCPPFVNHLSHVEMPMNSYFLGLLWVINLIDGLQAPTINSMPDMYIKYKKWGNNFRKEAEEPQGRGG